MPLLTPSTIPAPETVAMPGMELLHVPPDVPSDNVIDDPIHTAEGPVIDPAPGVTLTVTGADTEQVPMV